MRVLLVNAHGADATVGGAELYTERLAEGLLRRGHEVSLLAAFPSRAPDGVPLGVLHADDWRASRTRRMRNRGRDVVARVDAALVRAVRASGADVVHTGNLPGISTAVWGAARRVGLPVVHTFHDYYLLCPRTTLLRPDGEPCRPHPLLCGLRARRLARWAPAVSDVIGVSRHVLGRHAELFPHARGHVVRHPFTPPPGRSFARPEGQLRTIGFAGALERTKGVHVLVELAPRLPELGLELRVAGEGRLRAEVEAAAARGELRYDGYVAGAAKEALLAACQLGLSPSVWEEPGGPPYGVLDWLSAGRPVLASRRGGLAEAHESVGGLVAAEPTADALLAALARLREPATWAEAVARVEPPGARDDEARWVDEHEAILEGALR